MRLPLAIAVALAAGLALAGCRGPRTEVRRRTEGPVAARVAAVYPYAFRWEEPPWRSFQKSMDAVLFLASTERLLVFGPGEFQVLRPQESRPLKATDLVAVLARRGLDARDVIVFRGWAERRIARTTGQVEGRGAVRMQSSEEVTYLARLEVVDGATGEVLVEVGGEAKAGDPALRPEYDPTPELTELHRQLVRAAWRELEPRLTAPPLAELPVQVEWLPAAVLDYTTGTERSLRERMLTMDALEAEVARLSVYRYIAPELPRSRMAQDLRLPGGLYVREVMGKLQDYLKEGDVICLVNGQPALGPHVLQRVLNMPQGSAVMFRVARDAGRIEVTVPWTWGAKPSAPEGE